jgi:hypothetical protein
LSGFAVSGVVAGALTAMLVIRFYDLLALFSATPPGRPVGDLR